MPCFRKGIADSGLFSSDGVFVALEETLLEGDFEPLPECFGKGPYLRY